MSELSGRPDPVPLAWVEVDVEEEFDATDAFWAARRRDNSRVRRLTLECVSVLVYCNLKLLKYDRAIFPTFHYG